jgi:hypothetical protein
VYCRHHHPSHYSKPCRRRFLPLEPFRARGSSADARRGEDSTKRVSCGSKA